METIKEEMQSTATEEKKLNIYEKLLYARYDLSKIDFKKSGYNEFKNFRYFELSDFMPYITEAEKRYGILSLIGFDDRTATLCIIDIEENANSLLFSFDMADANVQGGTPIQQKGAEQTYARRYLYMAAYNICESDEIDGNVSQPQQAQRRQTPNQAAQNRPQSRESNRPNQTLMKYSVDENGEIKPQEGDRREVAPSYYKRIVAECKERNVDIKDVQDYCKREYGVNQFNKLSEKQFNVLLNTIREQRGQ